MSYSLEDSIYYMYNMYNKSTDGYIDEWDKENFYPQAEERLQELLSKLQSYKQLTKEEYTFIIFMYKYKLKIYNSICNDKDSVKFYSNFYKNIDTDVAYKAYREQSDDLSIIKVILKSSIYTYMDAKKWMINKGYKI